MTTNYKSGSSLQNVFVPPSTPLNPSKTALIFAGRNLNVTNQIINTTNNQPFPSLYIPFNIGSFPDGLSALAYLGELGFNYTLGKNFNPNPFSAPNSATADPSTGLVTLVWNDINNGLQLLIGQSPQGSVIQTHGTTGSFTYSTANIVSVDILGGNIVVVVSPIASNKAPFNTTDLVTFNVELKSEVIPDPQVSDEVCVAGFWFFEQGTVAAPFSTQPNLLLSVYVSGRDLSISPLSGSISLVAPTSVSAVLPDGSFNLIYPASTNNLGLLPDVYFGNTTITQGTAATDDFTAPEVLTTGVFNGFSFGPANTVIINVINVVGTLGVVATTVTLDVSKNGFSYLGKTEVAACGLCYKVINPVVDFGVGGKYNDYYVGVKSLRIPDAYKDNKFNVYGYFGYVSTTPNVPPINQLVANDELGFNWIVKLDINGVIQPTVNEASIVAQLLYNDINNEYPYNGTFGENAVLVSPGSNNSSTLLNGNQLNQLANQGVNVLGVNTLGQQYIYANLTTLQTINTIPINTYNRQDYQLKVRYLDKNYVGICNSTVLDPVTGMRLNNTKGLADSLQSNLKAFLTLTYNNGNGIIGNTNNVVIVILNPQDPSRFLVSISTTVALANSGSDITAYFTSYTI